eukprot:CAMPEP_0195643038 /NCGR_PEP_ID=MMETSP0815-20121206/27615_1 /TAXON_ID=97485 /ORGANISM="Prymnesium parvum, Strain Texoma1" /LENGTH=87 /DNA_ID=CAMNT_0040786039 /DNA_START=233 /DNA_END=493 /DNA_ORIENTATION=+
MACAYSMRLCRSESPITTFGSSFVTLLSFTITRFFVRRSFSPWRKSLLAASPPPLALVVFHDWSRPSTFWMKVRKNEILCGSHSSWL